MVDENMYAWMDIICLETILFWKSHFFGFVEPMRSSSWMTLFPCANKYVLIPLDCTL